jgi:hypothetical protein
MLSREAAAAAITLLVALANRIPERNSIQSRKHSPAMTFAVSSKIWSSYPTAEQKNAPRELCGAKPLQ